MHKKYNIFEKLINLFPYLFVFLSSIHFPIDPDLGWHLKYGEYFFRYGKILRENNFSAMMPDYRWVNHSWGTDILTYLTFINFNFLGLTILGGIIITATFFFFSKAFKLSFWEEVILFPVTLFFTNPVNQVSFRSQILSIMFLGILFFTLNRYKNRNFKRNIFILILFTVWANLHGEFILGFIILLLFEGLQALRDSYFSTNRLATLIKGIKEVFILALFAFLGSLINPFETGVYLEAINHFGNPSQKLIIEWTSIEQLSDLWWKNIIVATLIFLGAGLSILNNKFKDKLPYIFLFLVFFILSFWERRYSWPMYYMTIPIISPLAIFLEPNLKKYKYISGSIFLFLITSVIFYFKLPLSQYYKFSWDKYCDYYYCSKNAANFIIKNDLQKKKLFTMYNWGGWIIWNYPKIKPTIDGRMSFWRDKKGYSAFLDYFGYEQNLKDINNSSYDVVLMFSQKPIYNRLLQLSEEKKWKMIYQDNYSGVFIRNRM